MIKIKYNFNDEEYEYEPTKEMLIDALIEFMIEDVKTINGKQFSYDGAYQMACFVTKVSQFRKELAEYYEDDLQDYFREDAIAEYNYVVNERWG